MWLIPLYLSALSFPFSYASEQVLLHGQQHQHGESHGPFDTAFERLVNKTLEYWHVPGMSIGVVDGNNTWTRVGVTN